MWRVYINSSSFIALWKRKDSFWNALRVVSTFGRCCPTKCADHLLPHFTTVINVLHHVFSTKNSFDLRCESVKYSYYLKE